MPKAIQSTPDRQHYSTEELIDTRRKTLLFARSFPDLNTLKISKKTAALFEPLFSQSLSAGMSQTIIPEICPRSRIVRLVTLGAVTGIAALAT
jgi:hypothetical protein